MTRPFQSVVHVGPDDSDRSFDSPLAGVDISWGTTANPPPLALARASPVLASKGRSLLDRCVMRCSAGRSPSVISHALALSAPTSILTATKCHWPWTSGWGTSSRTPRSRCWSVTERPAGWATIASRSEIETKSLGSTGASVGYTQSIKDQRPVSNAPGKLSRGMAIRAFGETVSTAARATNTVLNTYTVVRIHVLIRTKSLQTVRNGWNHPPKPTPSTFSFKNCLRARKSSAYFTCLVSLLLNTTPGDSRTSCFSLRT